MTTVYDIPADVFIKRLSEYLMENLDIKSPQWAEFAKTSANRERLPERKDWWHIRCASLLRKIYLNGPIGISTLRLDYGGKKSGKSRPKHFMRGGGNILRKALQQMESVGLVKNIPKKGRIITDEGRSQLDKLANEIKTGKSKK